MSFPWDARRDPDAWFTYRNTSDEIALKHFYRRDDSVNCPHCGQRLGIEAYRAECCGQEFKTGFGEIRQRAVFGVAKDPGVRGWASLKRYSAAGHPPGKAGG